MNKYVIFLESQYWQYINTADSDCRFKYMSIHYLAIFLNSCSYNTATQGLFRCKRFMWVFHRCLCLDVCLFFSLYVRFPFGNTLADTKLVEDRLSEF